MIDPQETRITAEKAVLIGLATDRQTPEQVEEYLDELDFLANTAGIVTEKRFTQRLHKPDGKFHIGSGKLAEIKSWIDDKAPDACVIFDDELSPAQQRNLEKELDRPVLDRPRQIL